MEATAYHFTQEDWLEHERFVQMFRAAKRRKREWQARMEVKLAKEEEEIRKRRAAVNALFDDWVMNPLDLQRVKLVDEDEENYIAIIVKRSHPQLPLIIETFDKQIALFKANKP